MQNSKKLLQSGFATGVLLAFISAQNASAAQTSGVTFDISAGAELWNGDTTYQIGGMVTYPDGTSQKIHTPLSELEWPMDMWMVGIDLGLHLGDRFTINGSIKKNASDPDDPMIDSDWGVWYLSRDPGTSPGDLDVYSESDITSFDAMIYDINAEWIIAKPGPTSFSIGIGLQEQTFEYEAALNYQTTYYLGVPRSSIIGDGRTAITYDITYTMAYFLVGMDLKMGPHTQLETQFAYAPLTDGDDEDNHRLRENGGKLSKGDMDGNAYMFEVSIRHNFTPSIFLEGGAHYTSIDVDGTQKQKYVNGMSIGTIEEKSESSQLSEFIRFGVAL